MFPCPNYDQLNRGIHNHHFKDQFLLFTLKPKKGPTHFPACTIETAKNSWRMLTQLTMNCINTTKHNQISISTRRHKSGFCEIKYRRIFKPEVLTNEVIAYTPFIIVSTWTEFPFSRILPFTGVLSLCTKKSKRTLVSCSIEEHNKQVTRILNKAKECRCTRSIGSPAFPFMSL